MRSESTDLDWGDQWVGAFVEPLAGSGARTILDLGCGTGNDVGRLARLGYRTVGADYSRTALHWGHEKFGTDASFLRADMAGGLPFRDGAFDAVMSNVAAHMFSDVITRRVFKDIERVIRRGGLLLLHVNAVGDRELRAQRRPEVREIEPNYVLDHEGRTMHFFSREYLVDLLSDFATVDLELVEITHRGTRQAMKRVWRAIATR